MSEFKTKAGTVLTISDIKGKPYLQVAQRLVWFREEHPDWSIETEFVSLDDKKAVARAVIKNTSGVILATAHKREDQVHFPDHMEKAETGAIGRALALLGYGTQFCADELDEKDRLADSPTDRHTKSTDPKTNTPKMKDPGARITEKQVSFLFAMARKYNWSMESVAELARNKWDVKKSSELTMGQLEELINIMKMQPTENNTPDFNEDDAHL